MKVLIEINGCDDSTCFIMDLNEDELSFLNKMTKQAAITSTYGCMPTITYYVISEKNYLFYENNNEDFWWLRDNCTIKFNGRNYDF